MPSQPYLPGPAAGGTNGSQLAWLTYASPNAMNSRTTDSLTTTMMLLKVADSLMPMTSSTVIANTMIIAGTLRTAPVRVHPSVKMRQMLSPASVGAVWANGADVNAVGMLMPRSRRNETTYPDQPTDTVDAANRYSRIRSQPMTQAISSPSVA